MKRTASGSPNGPSWVSTSKLTPLRVTSTLRMTGSSPRVSRKAVGSRAPTAMKRRVAPSASSIGGSAASIGPASSSRPKARVLQNLFRPSLSPALSTAPVQRACPVRSSQTRRSRNRRKSASSASPSQVSVVVSGSVLRSSSIGIASLLSSQTISASSLTGTGSRSHFASSRSRRSRPSAGRLATGGLGASGGPGSSTLWLTLRTSTLGGGAAKAARRMKMSARWNVAWSCSSLEPKVSSRAARTASPICKSHLTVSVSEASSSPRAMTGMLPPVPEGSASFTRELASAARPFCRSRLSLLSLAGSVPVSLVREVRPTTRIVPD